jgi:hypothetical protein
LDENPLEYFVFRQIAIIFRFQPMSTPVKRGTKRKVDEGPATPPDKVSGAKQFRRPAALGHLTAGPAQGARRASEEAQDRRAKGGHQVGKSEWREPVTH